MYRLVPPRIFEIFCFQFVGGLKREEVMDNHPPARIVIACQRSTISASLEVTDLNIHTCRPPFHPEFAVSVPAQFSTPTILS